MRVLDADRRGKALILLYSEGSIDDAEQQLYGSAGFEYPINPAVELSEGVKACSGFREDRIRIAELVPRAQWAIDKPAW